MRSLASYYIQYKINDDVAAPFIKVGASLGTRRNSIIMCSGDVVVGKAVLTVEAIGLK